MVLFQIFDGINGLLLPGGNAPLTGDGGYATVGGVFFDWAKEANDQGDFFPVRRLAVTIINDNLCKVLMSNNEQSRCGGRVTGSSC